MLPEADPLKGNVSHVGFPGGSVVENLPAKQETQVRFLGQEDPPEKEMATHSSILAWRIPWTRLSDFHFTSHNSFQPFLHSLHPLPTDLKK